MMSFEIESLLEHLNGFGGVYSANRIPKLKPTSKCKSFICNTDPSHLPGKHWFAMNTYKKGKKNILEVFDSYGTKSKIKHPKTWVIKTNKNCFQSLGSVVCGEYSIFFCHQRLLGNSFNQIIFALKKSKNPDKLVENYTLWLKHNIPKKINISCENQYCKKRENSHYPLNLIIK